MRVEIYTDGSCSSKGTMTAPGGWAAVLRTRLMTPGGGIYYPHERVIKGSAWAATSVEMELRAILEGLSILNEHAAQYQVHIYTDCQECIDICTKKYRTWITNGWRTRDGKAVQHREMIEKILTICRRHDPVWHWVKSHSDNDLNNRVDELAYEEMTALAAQMSAAPSKGKDFNLEPDELAMVIEQLEIRAESLRKKAKDLKGKPGSVRAIADITETRRKIRSVIRKLH